MRRLIALIVAGLAFAAPAVAHALPAIDVECNQSPTCEGVWFTQPVFVDWTVTGGTITSGCQDTMIQEDTSGRIEGCAASGGGTASANITLKVDRTPPVVTDVVPDRPPDHDGWYSRAVTFVPNATDITSGIASCDSTTYGGPDSASAALVGNCRDKAGNVGSRAFQVRYDATPPDPSAATVKTGDRMVRLAWPAGATASVMRTPGTDGANSSVIYEGAGTGIADREVRNSRRYQYVLTLTDQAGNAASRELLATPGRRLLTPAKRAVLAAPPLLKWTPVRGARYYNVQLFRNGRKILSAWPRKAELQLKRKWRFHGRRYRLVDASYHWYVWPGEGPRDARRYGKRIGARSFVVARP